MARVVTVGADAAGNGTFLPIPTGVKLRGVIFDIEEGVTGPNAQTPGAPQAIVTVKITSDYQFEGTDEKGEILTQNAKGREIRYNNIPLAPSKKQEWVLASFAKAVGWPVTKNAKGDLEIELPDNLKEIQGTEVDFKVGQRQGQGDGRVYNTAGSWSKPSVDPEGGTPAVKPAGSWNDL